MKCKVEAWQKYFSQPTDELSDLKHSGMGKLSLSLLLTEVTCKKAL